MRGIGIRIRVPRFDGPQTTGPQTTKYHYSLKNDGLEDYFPKHGLFLGDIRSFSEG